jgi:hypothetical protein
MTAMSVAGGLAGVMVAVGVLLVVAGLRPVPVEVAARSAVARLVVRGPQLPGRVWRRLTAAAAAGLAALLVTGWPVAGVAAAVAVGIASGRRPGRQVERQLARLDGLEAWTRRLGDLLGAGAGGLEQAVAGSARTCPAPIQADVAALAGRWPVLGAEAALRGFAADLADTSSPAADMVAAALILRVRRGGRGLRPVLAALADDVAALVRARRAVEADRAKPRANARVLTALTVAVLAAALIAARDYLAPFNTAGGQWMLAVIAGVFAAGFALMARITRPPTGIRILAPTGRPVGASATVDGHREGSWG